MLFLLLGFVLLSSSCGDVNPKGTSVEPPQTTTGPNGGSSAKPPSTNAPIIPQEGVTPTGATAPPPSSTTTGTGSTTPPPPSTSGATAPPPSSTTTGTGSTTPPPPSTSGVTAPPPSSTTTGTGSTTPPPTTSTSGVTAPPPSSMTTGTAATTSAPDVQDLKQKWNAKFNTQADVAVDGTKYKFSFNNFGGYEVTEMEFAAILGIPEASLDSDRGTKTIKLTPDQAKIVLQYLNAHPQAAIDTTAAKALIAKVKTADITRTLAPVALKWTPTLVNLQEFAGTDKTKLEVINLKTITPNVEITSAHGFYENNQRGGAFANTFKSTNIISYRGQNSLFAEVFFQAEKLLRYANDPKDRASFQAAFNVSTNLKNTHSGPNYVKEVNKIVTLNLAQWKTLSIGIMDKIHAARFQAEPDLFLALVSTPKDSVLVENAKGNDKIWGNDADGSGKNFLGLLYMTHRQRFLNDFSSAHGQPFDKDKPEHVAFMLDWLKRYNP